MPESTRPQARSTWYRGRGSNSTAPLCRRGALDQKATPAFLAVGAGFEPAMSWLTASCLATWLPHKNWSGTSDSNRDSLGPRPSGLTVSLVPDIQIWSERLESNQRPRASETRALIQLSYAHTHWNRRPESNRHFFVRTEVFYPLNNARTNWGDRRELNPRGQIHSLPPKPLGHGHTWCQGHESNVLVRLFRPAP
jgi:hypothetical protein